MADPKDVKVSGDVKVATPPPPPPAEPKKEEAKPAPAAPAAEEAKSDSGFKLDSKSVYVAPEVAYGCRSAGNKEEDAHCGPSIGLTLGYPNLLFGDHFFLRPEFRYRKEWASRDIPAEFGPGIQSKANFDILGLGATFGANLHRYFGLELGLNLGAAHISAEASEDGRTGFRYHDNRFAYSADNWALNVDGRLAAGIPEQQVTSWLQLGGKVFGSLGYNPFSLTPDSISRPESDPAIPVNSVYWNVGGAIVGRFGEVAKPYKPAPKEEPKAAAPAPAPVAVAAVPQGVKDVQSLVDPLKAETKKQLEMKYAENAASYATQAAEKAASKKKDDRAIAQDTAKLAVEESKKASTAYKAATEVVTKAEAALAKLKEDKTLKPEHLKLAEEAVVAVKAEADKLKEESHKAWESATAAVKSYNTIKGLPKKEQIEFKDEDPAKPVEAKPEPKKEEPKPAAPKGPAKGGGIE